MIKNIYKDKIQKASAMLIVSAGLFVLIAGFRTGDYGNFLEFLNARLHQYNHDFYTERAYLASDRFVYRPGEDVWFQGFVSSPIASHGISPSEDLYIKLLNSKGEEIVFRRYPIDNNQVTGRFLIPRTSIPGKYYLVAYTGWMKNQGYNDVFRKEILISRFYEKRFRVSALYDRVIYFQGDSMHAALRLIDQSGKPLTETLFDYTIETLSHTYIRGTTITDDLGYSRVKCILPDSRDALLMKIEIKNRKLSGSYMLLIPTAMPPEITFYPESGYLLTGIDNTVAFRSTGPYALPAPIEGEIINRQGKVLAAVKSNNMGLGRFDYEPTMDTAYLRVTIPAGTNTLFPLPAAREKGLVLHLTERSGQSAAIRIRSNNRETKQVTYWVAVMDHKIVWDDSISFTGDTTVNIPIEGLTEGILQLSVFNAHGTLEAERLLRVGGIGQRIAAKTDRQKYQPRQRVTVTIDYTGNSPKLNLALSVATKQLSYNASLMSFESILNSFPSDTMLNMTRPSHYPTDLDLLCTQYRMIRWNEVLESKDSPNIFRRYDGLSGKVIDRKENLSQHAKVMVTHIPNYRLYETQTNENGSFRIPFGSDVIDFNFLNLEAYDALGKVNLTTVVDHNYSENIRNSLIKDEENSGRQKITNVLSYGDPDVIYSLRYGQRRFIRSDNEPGKKYNPNLYSNYASVMEIIQEIKPYEIRNGLIVFSEMDQEIYLPAVTQEGTIIVINGALKGNKAEILNNLLPSDITNINISTSLLDVHRYTPINFQAVIELTTIQGMYRYRQPSFQLGTDILNTSREFFSPDYSLENPTSTDSRKTLYWNPQITISKGQPSLITFYTSDIRGEYFGIMEGMDSDGKPIRAEFFFTVE